MTDVGARLRTASAAIGSNRIPFEGASLPGYFVSAGAGRDPTLLVLGGDDSTAEELMLWIGNACGPRGFNALVFEGPGQVGAVDLNPGLVFRPDYEGPCAPRSIT